MARTQRNQVKFIKLTDPHDLSDVYIQPDDVKGVSLAQGGEYTDILLYGTESVFIGVKESPAEVVKIVEDILFPKPTEFKYPGRS
jgi:hypothetical protein